MKHPWQIWSLFALCLALVTPAMLWLTHTVLELDRAESLAQQEAELEERVSSALWQIDSELTRLLAPEIARPAYTFQAFLPVLNGNKTSQQLPSPLLRQPSSYVRLHFELRSGDRWTSPQCPEESLQDLAFSNEVTPDDLQRSRDQLAELSRLTTYDQLVQLAPEQNLERIVPREGQLAANSGFLSETKQRKVLNNTLDYSNIKVLLQQSMQGSNAQVEQPSQTTPIVGQADYAEQRSRQIQSRQESDLQNRNQALQAAAQQSIWDQRNAFYRLPNQQYESEGISQPLWLGSQLLLVRRAERDGEVIIQGCWLDWNRIRAEALRRVADLVPQADLVPLTTASEVPLSRVLVALPVELVVPTPTYRTNLLSPVRVAIAVAWAFLLLATIALAVLLRGVVALSERRAAFVSAVTHELRTPLTTFRMYAEMLAEGMVERHDQQRTYLNTLKNEADRLTHLVENVLQYARLERNSVKKRPEKTTVAEIVDRVRIRLTERAATAQMELSIETAEEALAVNLTTDASAVEQILFNLVDNACKYAGNAMDQRIHLEIVLATREVLFRVRDHGPGIELSETRRLFQPFCKSAQQAADTAPGVGLGLALSRRLAMDLGARLDVECETGPGASFVLHLPR